MNRKAIALCVSILAVVMLAPIIDTPDVAAQSNLQRVFYEDFEDSDVNNNPTWTYKFPDDWAVTNGELHIDGTDFENDGRWREGFNTQVSFETTDYIEISFRGRLKSQGNPQEGLQLTIAIGAPDDRRYDLGMLFAPVGGWPMQNFTFYEMYGTANILITSPSPPERDTWYQVRAVRESGIWSLYVDNTLIGTATDTFGLYEFTHIHIPTTGSVVIDDIEVWVSPPEPECHTDAPESVNENDPFTATVTCNGAIGVYGFEYDLNIDPTSPTLFPQDTAFTPGNIFSGLNTLTLINNLDDGYAVSLQGEPVGVSGDVTLGSIGYDTDDPGTVTLTLDDLLLGNRDGDPIDVTTISPTTIDIIDLALASIEGDACRETGDNDPNEIVVSVPGAPPELPIITPTSDLCIHFSYDVETVPTDASLEISAPGHLSCLTPNMGLPDDTHVVLDPITLLAGDVNGDGEINITDASIIVTARIGEPVPPGYMPDLDEDGRISVLDLIHVGRNYGETTPTCI